MKVRVSFPEDEEGYSDARNIQFSTCLSANIVTSTWLDKLLTEKEREMLKRFPVFPLEKYPPMVLKFIPSNNLNVVEEVLLSIKAYLKSSKITLRFKELYDNREFRKIYLPKLMENKKESILAIETFLNVIKGYYERFYKNYWIELKRKLLDKAKELESKFNSYKPSLVRLLSEITGKTWERKPLKVYLIEGGLPFKLFGYNAWPNCIFLGIDLEEEFAFWQILAIVAHEGCHILLKSKPFVYDNPIIVRAYREELGMARTINECIVRAIERKVIEIYEPEYVSHWENSVEKEGLKELINVIQRIHEIMRRRGLTINELSGTRIGLNDQIYLIGFMMSCS